MWGFANMRKQQFWVLAVLFAWFGKDGTAQQKQPVASEQEDCGVTFNFTVASSGIQAAGTVTAGSTGTTAVIDNRQSACVYWKVAYSPNSATASVSLRFQTALDVAGVPTTWSNYPGTLDSGINPNTAVTTGGARTEASGVEYPFLRMNMTVLTGAGARVQGKLTGWKSRPPITANAVIVPGTLCPAGTPCAVVGIGTPGAQSGGVVTVQGDPAGTPIPVSFTPSGTQVVEGNKTNDAAAPGANNVGVIPCIANAAAPTWTEGNQVECSVDLAGNLRTTATVTGTLTGNKTNNAAAPGATNIGSLGAIANAAEVTYTEGFLVLPSVDLAGILRMNVSRINGVVPLMGNGATGTGSERVTLANNNTGIANFGHGATGAAPPVNATYAGILNSGATGGLLGGIPAADQYYNINIATATTTLAITGVAGRHVRISHINMVSSGTQNIGILSGTGGTCGTGTTAIVGTTAATGYNWTAQTGISAGNGLGTIMRTTATGDSVCLITSAAVQISGVIAFSIY